MKLAIIDSDHFEVLASLLGLFDGFGHDITVYSKPALKKQVDFTHGPGKNTGWILQEADETNRAFLARTFRDLRLNKPDLLFISTASNNHLLIALNLMRLRNMKVLLTIHDINSYIRFPSFVSLRAIVRHAGKRLLFRRVNAIHVLSKRLADYLREETGTSKPVFVIPGRLYHPDEMPGSPQAEPNLQLIADATLQVVIPGSIDERRREYRYVFEFLESAARHGLRVQLTLLGTFPFNTDPGTIARFRDYANSHEDLILFDGPLIDQPLFDRVLDSAHFIWTPLTPVLDAEPGVFEIYGKSACSGNIGDIIRSAKPYIAPSWLPVDHDMVDSCIVYANMDGLASFLQDLTPEKYRQLAMAAMKTSLTFTPERIRDRYRSLFQYLTIQDDPQP